MKELYFFDAYARIGPRPGTLPGDAWRLSDLLEEMAFCSISGALVASSQSVLYDPETGNRELSELLTPYPQLFPVWNVAPANAGGMASTDVLERELREQGVKAVSLHPFSNGWDWHASGSRQVLDVLSDRQLLTIVPRGEIDSLQDFEHFLAERPLLPVLLAGVWPGELARVAEMMHSRENLHVGFTGFQPCGWIESLCDTGLAERLVFATGAPQLAIGPHRAMIDYADLDEETRQKIAGANLIELLEGQQPDRISANRGEDALMRAARAGRELPCPVVDLDACLVLDEEAGGNGVSAVVRAAAGRWFSLQRRIGGRGGGIASWRGTVGMDCSNGNEAIRRMLDEAPPGFWGMATIDPVHYAQDELAPLMSSVYDDRRFLGLRPSRRLGLTLIDPRYEVWWRFGDRHRFVAVVEGGEELGEEVPVLAGRFSHLSWMIVPEEGSAGLEDWVELIDGRENVWLATSCKSWRCGHLERLLQRLPGDRLIFAGGAGRIDPRQALGAIVFSRLPLETKQQLLGGNALKLMAPFRQRLPEELFA